MPNAPSCAPDILPAQAGMSTMEKDLSQKYPSEENFGVSGWMWVAGDSRGNRILLSTGRRAVAAKALRLRLSL